MKILGKATALLLVIILLAFLPVTQAAAAEKWDGAALTSASGQPEDTCTIGADVTVQKEKAPVVWIVLFGVSLLGNIVQLTLMVWKKKDNRKKEIDDVPLVDYDIDDDVI